MQPSDIAPRDRLIVALDLPAVAAAEAMIVRLGDSVTFYKIGYQLAYAGGLPLVRQLASAGKKVFVDLKLHDIGNTVARGVESVAQLGATFLTVHAYPQTMKAAVGARAGSGLKILAVTVLTSYDDGDLHAAGYRLGVSDLVEARAQQAQVFGVDGLVCSPEEAASLRKIVLEFKDYETALACYNSPEYARLVALRAPHSEADILVIEGYDGAQP